MNPTVLLASFVPRTWEVVALVAAGLAAAARLWLARPRRVERRWITQLRALARFDHPWAWDVVLVLLAAVWHFGALRDLWARISPYGSPMGPDSDVTFLSAVALETGQTSLYSLDRYPAFPWSASQLAHGSLELAGAGLQVSMAATVLLALAAYALARQLGGRFAGFVAMCLVLRLPGVADAGRQFTPYAAIAAFDLVGVAALVALGGGRLLGAVPLAVAAAVVFAADPKQLPVALLFVGIGAIVAFWTRRWLGVLAAAGLLAALPLMNLALARANLPIASVEAITARVPLGFVVDPRMPLAGWSPGDPFVALFTTLLRVAKAVHVTAGRSWLEEAAGLGVRMELPDTSMIWLVPLVLWPVAGLGWRRGWREAVSGPSAAVLAVLPLAPVVLTVLHLHFQHRYFLAVAVVLPPLVAIAVARWAGPAGVLAVGLVALLFPSSPWSQTAPGLLAPPSRQTDGWAGPEARDWSATVSDLTTRLPEDAYILDYASSRPWVMLTTLRPYYRCTALSDSCRSLLAKPGHLYAVLFPQEGPSVSEAPGTSALGTGLGVPEKLGDCWLRVAARPGNGALYAWTCDLHPSIRTPPPRPPGSPGSPPGAAP